MGLDVERLVAEAAAAAPKELNGMLPVSGNMFSSADIVQPRHAVPVRQQLPHFMQKVKEEGLCFYVRAFACVEMPNDITKPLSNLPAAPVGALCGDGRALAAYIKAIQNSQKPEWERCTTAVLTGRTAYNSEPNTGALSATVFVPVPTSFCLELPRRMDGRNLTTSKQADAYMTELDNVLKAILFEEMAKDSDDSGQAFKFRCNPGHEPKITYDYSFAWRERANGWDPDPDDKTETKTISYPVITIRAVNAWSARRFTSFFENKDNSGGIAVPKCPCNIMVNVWEAPRNIATDVRVLCENKWKSCGWYRITNCVPAKWTATHTDVAFGVAGPECVQVLADDTSPAPITILSFDMECVSSRIRPYLKLLEGNVNRFPKATDPTNTAVIICVVVTTADGRRIVVSLQLNDLPNMKSVLHQRTMFHSQGLDIQHDHFLVPDERLLITLLRDFTVFYDADVISSYNGDGFDWPYLFCRMHKEEFSSMSRPPLDCPYLRFYYMSRLIWQENWQIWTACIATDYSNGVSKPKYIPIINEKDRKKNKNLLFRGIPYGRYGSFPGANITLNLSGRTSCDVMSLVKLLGKSNSYYVFERYTLKAVCDRLLAARRFNKLDTNLFGYWHRTDREDDPQNPGRKVPPEEQRRRLAQYCVVDAMCPQLILQDCNMIPFMEVLANVTGATLQKVINAGKTAQITPMFIAKAWDQSRNWVCNINSEGPRDYTGGLVIPPFPQSLAGVEQPTDEDLLPFEQQENVDTNFDWTDVWTDSETKQPMSEILRDMDLLRECSCKSRAILKVLKVKKDSYDPVNQTILATVEMRLCDHTEMIVRTCCIPAQYRNKDVIVVLDFQSLYPSIMRTNYNCGSTVRRINYKLDKAEYCDAYTRLFVEAKDMGLEDVEKYIRDCLQHEQDEREMKARNIVEARRKQLDMQTMSRVFDNINMDNIFGEDDAEDGVCVMGDVDDDFGANEESDDGCAKTGTYAPGDGDFSHESPEDNKNFVSVQETTPDGQLFVHKLARPHIRQGICYQLVTIALNERARIRAEMADILQRIKSFPLLTDDMLRAALSGQVIHTQEPKNKKEKVEQAALEYACETLIRLLGQEPADQLAEVGNALKLQEVVAFIESLKTVYDRMDIEQNIMKIIANSVYGILASRVDASILSNVNAAACVTAQARSSLNTIRRAMNVDMKKIVAENPEKYGGMEVMGVIYGDTDSVFVHLRSKDDKYTWLFLEDAAAYVNDHTNGPFKHIRDCKLNLQAEAKMDAYTILGPKTYISMRDDGKVPKIYSRGVATVRRDRPPVLTKLLSRLFKLITSLNTYARPVLRAVLLREVHLYIEELLSNRIPYEDFFITQRVLKLPSGLNFNTTNTTAASSAAADDETPSKHISVIEFLMALQKKAVNTVKKAAQHIEVAIEIFNTTGEPPRTGDSVTYVLTKNAKGEKLKARPTQVVAIDDIDRIGYFTNRIKTSLMRVLDVFVGLQNSSEFFRMYENAFSGVVGIEDMLNSNKSSPLQPGPQRRWKKMREWTCGPPPRKSEKHTLPTANQLNEQARKRSKMTTKAVGNSVFSLNKFFGT
jgi:DNA polymerase elongation subunit (family B)